MKPRPPGSRRGRTLTLELPPELKAAIEAAAAAAGLTVAEWSRQALAVAAGGPAAVPPSPAELQTLAQRLEGVADRLESLRL